ncbi:putative YigZ family protein [Clostridiales Family XIII bacterium PM5-7]
MIRYSTVLGQGKAEQVIDKSRFIAHVKPISSKEEGEQFIGKIKKEYKDATHNVPAMVIGEEFQVQWASDDGEPQGTSGAPMVQMLVQEGITNVAVVVTRYFGGIKLGTGGLVRAYTGSAQLGLKAAGICDVKEMMECNYHCDYSVFHKIQNHSFSFPVDITDIEYLDVVHCNLVIDPVNQDALMGIVADISNGTAILSQQTVTFRKIKR